MSEQDRIFRQAALDKLSSPEQLDQVMQVITPRGWLALLAALLLLGTASVWSVLGRLPNRVTGQGILIRPGGVLVVAAHGTGTVREIMVQPNDPVLPGQVIAELYQPELEIKRHQAELAQQRLQEEQTDLKEYHRAERQAQETDLEKQRVLFRRIASDYEKQVEALKLRVAAGEKLKEAGIETELTLLDGRVALHNAEHDLARVHLQLEQLDLAWLQSEQRRRQDWLAMEQRIQENAREVEWARSMYTLNSRVVSPYSGEVLEVVAKRGQPVEANAPIISVQSDSRALEVRLYLTPSDGKLVRTNMPVQLNPVSVKKEEYGLLLGRVGSVSAFPATPQAMLSRLENPALVSEFTRGGAPIEVVVSLDPSPDTPSGYAWTSHEGPPESLTSGTLCSGSITLSRRAPISLVVPLLKKEEQP